MSKKVDNISVMNETFCGSPDYLSPEVVKRAGYNYMRDIFSLGVLTFELLHGNSPFYAEEVKEIYSRILNDKPLISAQISLDCMDFIQSCLEKDPAKRLGSINGMADVLSHPWIRTIVYNITRENHKHNPFQSYIKGRPFIHSSQSTSEKLLNEWFQAEAVNGSNKRYFDFSFRYSIDKPFEFADLEENYSQPTSLNQLSLDSLYDPNTSSPNKQAKIRLASNIQLHS